jgi:hypothetical protein
MIADDDFYFDDASTVRTTIAVGRSTTGASGAALIINGASPASYTGSGGEPTGCIWPATVASTTAGVIRVNDVVARTAGGDTCPL